MNKKISIGKNISVSINMDKLLKLKEEFSKKYVTRVGVLGQKNNRIPIKEGESHAQYKIRVKSILRKQQEEKGNEEKTNAEIGLKQEVGSLSEHIPRRSFLEMPLTLKMPDYYKTFSNQLMKAIDEGNIKPVYVNLGIKGEQIVQMAFASRGFGQWPDNSPVTVARKGSSSPLIDTGQLRKSITSDVISK